jgi:predicted dehydrogenase
MVSDPDLDALALSVPPPVQAEVALAAVKAGKHLFAEKPLAMCTSEAQAIVDAAAATGSVGAVDFEFRVIPAWLKAREIVQKGELGRVRRVFISWRLETFAYRTNQRTWKREEDGGVLNLFVSHSFDSIEWMFGRVQRLTARLEPATGGDARAEVWLELVDGPNVSISAASDLAGGSGHRVEIYGDESALYLENLTSDYISGFTLKMVSRSGQSTTIELPPAPVGEDGRVSAVGEVVRRFVDAIEGHAPMSPGLRDGLAVQRLLDMTREAHRSRTWSS